MPVLDCEASYAQRAHTQHNMGQLRSIVPAKMPLTIAVPTLLNNRTNLRSRVKVTISNCHKSAAHVHLGTLQTLPFLMQQTQH